MPKTKKRQETKRAARIARAHSSEPPRVARNRPVGPAQSANKAPARGLARYPWATAIVFFLIILVVYVFYLNHIWPFPQPQTEPVQATSPCVQSSMITQIDKSTTAPLSAEDSAKITRSFSASPAMTIDKSKKYCAGITTSKGLVIVELDPSIAPNSVNNFVYLAQNHFYDGLPFHRVLQTGAGAHIVQSGDSLWNDADATKHGTGGPGYTFADEPVQGNYTDGTIAMANSGANTNGSQFFINTSDNSSVWPNKNYNLFGKVVQGLDIVKSIQGPGDGQTVQDVKPDQINYLVVVAAP